jgi:putative isomerase
MKVKIILLVLGLIPFLLSCDAGNENHAVKQDGLSEKDLATPAIDLAKGWNTWDTYNVLSHVLLPQGLAIKLQLLDGQSGEILEDALIGRSAFDSMEHVTAGPHAYDGSYTELELEWHDIHVRVQSAAVDDELYLLITPLDTAPGDSLIVKPQMMWDREGEVSISRDVITAKMSTRTIDVAVQGDQLAASADQVKVALASTIALSTETTKSVEEIASVIDSARTDFLSERSDYGNSAELFDAMQTVLAWNVIYEPTNDRVITPVSRRWNVGWGGWILFEWDTYFAAYMHALNNKELAYANVFAMTSEITDRGFVPNFASSRNKSEDRSEPPVGSFVIREIYRKYREKWFVREVFEELLTWNRWWAGNRDIDGYLAWGSDPYEHEELPEWLETAIGEKQGAQWESGLDNSPMFDDATHDSESHQLMLADVGLMSLYILDCQSLSDLAGVLGKHEIQTELSERAEAYTKKLETLWIDELGLYLNKDLVTGEFSYRLSPTLFYPLLANVPDQHQAKRMIKEHFYNPDEFWGEYMIPSIARNDEAFKDNTYWRGRIWAPMNFLVYLGIRNYDLPNARKDFVEKSTNLLLQSWTEERHVYENYNSETGRGDDAGMSDKFYHWGALLGFIGLMEEGCIASPQLPLNEEK